MNPKGFVHFRDQREHTARDATLGFGADNCRHVFLRQQDDGGPNAWHRRAGAVVVDHVSGFAVGTAPGERHVAHAPREKSLEMVETDLTEKCRPLSVAGHGKMVGVSTRSPIQK